MQLQPDDALVIVDVQRDFLAGGSLAVPGGDAIVPALNESIERFAARRLPIYATRDWHPAQHCSFRAAGGPWPPHCVAGTTGAEFAAGLRLPRDVHLVSKASSSERDAYSAFNDTDFHARLRGRHVLRLFIAGLATDYCVLSTVLDALTLGYHVVVLSDAVAAVDAQPGDGQRALERMRTAGALISTSRMLH